jgi:DNA-binding response OmpR family regulator
LGTIRTNRKGSGGGNPFEHDNVYSHDNKTFLTFRAWRPSRLIPVSIQRRDSKLPLLLGLNTMTQQNPHILVVDDDPDLHALLGRYLSEQGFDVTAVEDGAAMDRFLATRTTDLIILDLMLPVEDGLSIAKRLRSDRDTPIIMLSARGEEVDRIVGLEVGADDYLPKPFSPRELLARIRAVLRRPTAPSNPESVNTQDQTFSFGPFQLDPVTQGLTRDDEKVSLTSGEYALLKIFVEHPNRVLSRDTLVDMLKGFERSPYDRSIDVRVTRLRRKIESDPSSPVYIHTVWGEGYRFSPGNETRPAHT